MSKRRQIDVTFSPFARAVWIVSTSVLERRVRDRLVGFITIPVSGSGVGGCSLPMSQFRLLPCGTGTSQALRAVAPSEPRPLGAAVKEKVSDHPHSEP